MRGRPVIHFSGRAREKKAKSSFLRSEQGSRTGLKRPLPQRSLTVIISDHGTTYISGNHRKKKKRTKAWQTNQLTRKTKNWVQYQYRKICQKLNKEIKRKNSQREPGYNHCHP
jgi:hypothetical protein